MFFRSYQDLSRDVVRLSMILPDYDLIVAVPRSGVFPAAVLSQIRNVRFTTIDYFTKYEGIFPTGRRKIPEREIKNIVVMDDSFNKGRSMKEARAIIEQSGIDKKYKVDYAVVYGSPRDMGDVKFLYKKNNHLFEWHLFNRPRAYKNWSMDIDGVLCPDPPVDEAVDKHGYINYITTAPVKYRPLYKLKLIVTSRLEKYREITETWLRNNGIEYDSLEMSPYKTPEERRKAGAWAENKMNAIRKHKTELHIESNVKQAKKIGAIVPTIYTDTMTAHQGGK